MASIQVVMSRRLAAIVGVVNINSFWRLTIGLTHHWMATRCSKAMDTVGASFVLEILQDAPERTYNTQLDGAGLVRLNVKENYGGRKKIKRRDVWIWK